MTTLLRFLRRRWCYACKRATIREHRHNARALTALLTEEWR